MYQREPLNHIHWSGQQSLSMIKGLLSDGLETIIDLPAHLQPAVQALNSPSATAARIWNLAKPDDASDILNKLSCITGLEDLLSLDDTLRQTSATIRILNSPTRILIEFPPHLG